MKCRCVSTDTQHGNWMRDTGYIIRDTGERCVSVCVYVWVNSCIILIFSSSSFSALPRASVPASVLLQWRWKGCASMRLSLYLVIENTFLLGSTMVMLRFASLRFWFILDRSIDATVAFIAFIRYPVTRKLVDWTPVSSGFVFLTIENSIWSMMKRRWFIKSLKRPMLRPLATQDQVNSVVSHRPVRWTKRLRNPTCDELCREFVRRHDTMLCIWCLWRSFLLNS